MYPIKNSLYSICSVIKEENIVLYPTFLDTTERMVNTFSPIFTDFENASTRLNPKYHIYRNSKVMICSALFKFYQSSIYPENIIVIR